MIFADDLSLRAATAAELDEIRSDPMLLATVERAVASVRRVNAGMN